MNVELQYEGRWSRDFNLGEFLNRETNKAFATHRDQLLRITGFQSVRKRKVIIGFKVQSIYIPINAKAKVAC